MGTSGDTSSAAAAGGAGGAPAGTAPHEGFRSFARRSTGAGLLVGLALGLTVALSVGLVGSARAQGGAPDLAGARAVPEGLWVATRRFGPDVRGRLLLVRDGAAWRAEVAGHAVPARVAGDTVRFALPDSAGSFSGRWARDRAARAGDTRAGGPRAGINGHWVQPRTVANGTPYASPVRLAADGPNRWAGDVVPLDDALTVFLRVVRRPDGTLGAFLRNPERNLGRQLRAERLEQVETPAGPEVRLVGRRNGRGEAVVLARGPVRSDGFSLDLPGRGGTYDFRRVGDGEHTPFYPRGRPDAAYAYHVPPALGDGWPVGTPESAGLSTDTLSAFVRALIAQSMDSLGAQQVHAVLVARRGRLVLEEYFHGAHRDEPHDTRSAAKSVTATLAGAAIQAGAAAHAPAARGRPPLTLASPVYAVMHGGRVPPDLEPRKRAITLEHLLAMASGLDCDDADPDSPGAEDTIVDQSAEPDYYRYALALRAVRDPGTRAVYCSIQPHLAGGVVQRATGRALPELFHDLLAQPLGIRRYHLNLAPTGDAYLGGGLRLTARDFAKFGQLYLNGGTWRGRHVLDPGFVRRATTPRFPLAGIRYGLLWWVIDYPFRGDTVQAYFAGGNGGQLVMVIPTLELVVATYAANYADPVTYKLQRRDVPTYILPAVRPAPAPRR